MSKKIIVKFELYGNQYEQEMSQFTELTGMLCKSIVDSNRNWKQFCETEFKIVEVNTVEE